MSLMFFLGVSNIMFSILISLWSKRESKWHLKKKYAASTNLLYLRAQLVHTAVVQSKPYCVFSYFRFLVYALVFIYPVFVAIRSLALFLFRGLFIRLTSSNALVIRLNELFYVVPFIFFFLKVFLPWRMQYTRVGNLSNKSMRIQRDITTVWWAWLEWQPFSTKGPGCSTICVSDWPAIFMFIGNKWEEQV